MRRLRLGGSAGARSLWDGLRRDSLCFFLFWRGVRRELIEDIWMLSVRSGRNGNFVPTI
jgi:hypothetical protein